MPLTLLEDRAVIELAGSERKTFLQGLITQDIDTLSRGRAIYAALLTPQGKYLFDFFLFEDGDRILIDCHRDHVDPLVRRLLMYRLRTPVGIESKAEEWRVAACFDGEEALPTGTITSPDPRHPDLGARCIVPAGLEVQDASEAYERLRLSIGIPDLPRDAVAEKTLILEADLDALNGVSFSKGCYVGQELTARMKHRGKVRRRLLPARIEGALPPHGTPITDGTRRVGELRSGLDDRAIVEMRLEDLRDAAFQSAGAAVYPFIPDWLRPHL